MNKENIRKDNRFKTLVVLLIALVFIGGSSAAFAWWDNLSSTSNEANIITIGEGLNIVVDPVEINPATSGNLVPASAVLKTGDTDEIVLTYTVRMSAALDSALNLDVTVTNILVAAAANPFGLIDVAVTNPGSIQNSDVTVTLSVTIDDSSLDPADEAAAYTALANNTISFDVTFTASEA